MLSLSHWGHTRATSARTYHAVNSRVSARSAASAERPVAGSGFRVQGAGCRVQGSGFRVQGSGFRVQGSGFRVQGSGFRSGIAARRRPRKLRCALRSASVTSVSFSVSLSLSLSHTHTSTHTHQRWALQPEGFGLHNFGFRVQGSFARKEVPGLGFGVCTAGYLNDAVWPYLTTSDISSPAITCV